MDPGRDTSQLLNTKDVAKLLKCSRPWVYKAAMAGILSSVRIPCPARKDAKKRRFIVRFKLDDILAFIETHYKARRP